MSRHAVLMSPGPPSAAGGVERFCAMLEELLEREGWRVSVVWPRSQPSRWAFRLGGSAIWWAASAARALDGARPDVILSNGFLGAAAPRGVPRISVFHGTMTGQALFGDVGEPGRERLRRIVGSGLAEARSGRGATVVAVAERAADEVRRFYRLPVHRVIANGVDVDRFAPRDRAEARSRLGLEPDGRYALFVGRLESRKGADLLGPACAQAGFELVVAGPSDPAVGRGLGPLTPEEMPSAYAAADCVVFPTRYEGCSFVVLEALASGAPLVTTRAGWMDTFLRHVPDYRSLVVWPDAADIAARLRSLDGLDLDGLTARAREWIVEHNSLERFEADWAALFEEVAGQPSS